MTTIETIYQQLKDMNAPQNKIVHAHSSLRAVGPVEGNGEAFLDALVRYFTADGGLFSVATHTWGLSGSPNMDATSDKTNLGMLSVLALRRPDGIRTEHPTHSMVIFGEPAKAAAYAAHDLDNDTSTSPKGCYGLLYDEDGYVLLIGVGHNRNTYLHSVEEMLGVPNRLTDEHFMKTIRRKDGSIAERPIRQHYAPGIGDVSAHFPKFEPAFRAHGAITDGFLGNAPTQLCSARIMKETLALIRERSRHAELLADDAPLDEALYR